MCSRYSRWDGPDDFAEFSDIRLPMVIPATYNAAPQSIQPIIRLSQETDLPEVVMARWGLIPYWAQDAKIGYSTFNARSEELADKPAFRESFQRRRCLIPANCFYEWKKLGAKGKQAFAIALNDQPRYAFAGLWDCWRGNGVVIESFTIATVAPNELMATIHDRMPAIIAPGNYARWLEASETLPVDLLTPFPANRMRAWPIGEAVGNVRNDSPDLIKEVSPEPFRF